MQAAASGVGSVLAVYSATTIGPPRSAPTIQFWDIAGLRSTIGKTAYVERLIGSIRRECLDHVIVLSVAGLQRLLADYVAYYLNTWTHLSLGKDAPASRPATPRSAGHIVEIPQVNGLHHRYDRAAA